MKKPKLYNNKVQNIGSNQNFGTIKAAKMYSGMSKTSPNNNPFQETKVTTPSFYQHCQKLSRKKQESFRYFISYLTTEYNLYCFADTLCCFFYCKNQGISTAFIPTVTTVFYRCLVTYQSPDKSLFFYDKYLSIIEMRIDYCSLLPKWSGLFFEI